MHRSTSKSDSLTKRALRGLLRVLFRLSITGNPASFHNERTLIVANHESLIDGLLLALFLPVRATFVVHTEVAKNALFRRLLTFIPHVVVDSTSPLAIKVICKLVESGEPVVIFPEGRLTVTGSLMKVYDGAGFVAARTGATIVPVRIEGAGQSYFGRLAGIYPLDYSRRSASSFKPARTIPMPQLPSAKLRRRRAGELMRRILLDMIVATRPQRTLFEAFLDAKKTFGSHYRLVEDVRMQEESYGSILEMSLALARILRPMTQVDEIIGVMTPNAAPTLGLILGLSAIKRVPAMLNYTAGADGIQAACVAAKITKIITSRAFVEKARLQAVVDRLSEIEVHYLEDLKSRFNWTDRLWVLWHVLISAIRSSSRKAPLDPAIVLFTSGSEGKPKGVVHSHASLLSNVAQVRSVADFSPLDKFMIALPVFHSFGLTCGVIMPLGVRLQSLPLPKPASLPHHSRTGVRPQLYGAVRHVDVPWQLRQICASLRFRAVTLRCIRRGKAFGGRTYLVDREVRHSRARGLWRYRVRTGGGRQHAHVVSRWQQSGSWSREWSSEIRAGARDRHAAGCCTSRAPTS